MTAVTGSAALVVASNRGPVVTPKQGGGGLIAIVGAALAGYDGAIWVSADQLPIEAAVYESYYGRAATGILWFAHHHLLNEVPWGGADWLAYEHVNRMFAQTCAQAAGLDATVLLLDYHLAVAPAMLRKLRPDLRIIHCTMCPWAEPAHFAVLPEWLRRKLIEGMLGAGSLCFFVPRWRLAFLECCAALGYSPDPAAVHAIPVGVDASTLAPPRDELSNVEAMLSGRRLLLRVDRLDPTKNILRGIEAYGRFLESHPSWRERILHYVLAYESRSGLAEYRSHSERIHALVAEVKERFGPDCIVLDTRNNLDRAMALMALADVLVVNPVRDGMNLVVKETAAVNRRDCAVILSREAGAADELGAGALVIDPLDVEALATAMAQALRLDPPERKRRLDLMRRAATAVHPRAWLDRVLATG